MNKKRKQRRWLASELKTLAELYKTHTYRECASIMGIDAKLVKSALSRNKITCGRTGRFIGGHIPHNKGKKGLNMGGVETQFKKGHRPANTKYDGAISARSDGYKYIRVGKSQWNLLHRYIWERKNGKIPAGKILIFINGDQMDCRPENLKLVTRAEHLRRNYNREKASLSMKQLYHRERVRKKYGISPISGHGKRITNYL